MQAEAIERLTPRTPRVAFWACVLLCDLVLLLLLPRVTWVAAALGGLVVLALFLARAEWPLAFLLLGTPFLAPLHLNESGQLWLLLGARALLLAAWWIALRGVPGVGATRAVTRALGDPATICALLLAALIWVSLSRSPAPLYGVGKAKSFLLANLCLYLAPLILWPYWRCERSLDRFLRAGIVLGALFAGVGVCAALGAGGALGARIGVPVPVGGVPTRLAWLGTDPIWTGRIVSIWMILLLWGASRGLVRRWVALSLAAVGLILLLRTGSRGPLAALLLSPLALLLLPRRPGVAGQATLRRWARYGIPALLIVGVVFLWVIPESERLRLLATLMRSPLGGLGGGGGVSENLAQDAGERLFQDPSVGFRMEMVRRSVTALVDGLPWGWGTGAFPALLFLRDFRLYPHNIEVELLIEQGLPGLLLFAAFLVCAWIYARSLARRSGTGAWLWVLLCMAFLNAQVSGDLTGNGEIWFWAGMIGGLHAARGPLTGAVRTSPLRPAG